MVFKNHIFTCSFFFVFLTYILFSCCVCHGSDRILRGQSLFRNQTIISKGGRFELGFFNPGNSSNYYIGIWYKNIPVRTVVWVANRNNPIPQSLYNDSRLQLSKDGNLQLIFSSERIWEISNGTEAVILDTGNFVVNSSAGDNIVWQSFDHPTDTWLPSGNIGYNRITGEEAKFFSWKNSDDPATGNYSLVLELSGGSELRVNLNNSQRVWRSSSSLPKELWPSTHFNFSASWSEPNSLVFNTLNESMNSRIVIDNSGIVRYLVWSEATKKWDVFWVLTSDSCTSNGFCGGNAICESHPLPNCSCLTGFAPHDTEKWDILNFTGGCLRTNPQCTSGKNDFTKLSDITLPTNGVFLKGSGSKLCERKCRKDCSCNAFAYSKELGCVVFYRDLFNLVRLPNSSAVVDLYIKMDTLSSGGLPTIGLVLIVLTGAGILICSIYFCYFWRNRKSKASQPEAETEAHQDLLLLDLNSDGTQNNKRLEDRTNSHREEKDNKYELPTFSFSSIAAATNYFSPTHKLGEGGFGPVYKGELLNGQFVAVKRLSKRSGQGLEEFKNEMELIAKLQHRNLVRILGCCIENDEKILVYEYMANKSLDFFLFDPTRKELLDWERRFHIIEGIAQGLLYLHHYSRLRIVHRDLKVSNILLDDEMNPKISDFGMARIFGGSDSQANTRRIVGTYGYMSPEYAMEGVFSVKSDVYAFGVLLLEIISGKKNTGFYGSNHLNLLGYAWNLWTNNSGLELIDPALKIDSSTSIPLRYIQIGLLCVQDNPGERPVMSDVVAMLNKEQIPVASAPHPSFTVGRSLIEESEAQMCSVNDITVSLIEAR